MSRATAPWLIVFLLLACQTGCKSPEPGQGPILVPPTAAQNSSGSPAPLSFRETTDAANLYTAKCAKCHKFYDPRSYSDRAWNSWMRKMARKARLTLAQEKLLSAYLDSIRQGPGPR
jgi:hypothetical protein